MSAPQKFTHMEIVAELERELAMRRNVFPQMIARARTEKQRKLKADCDRRVAIIEQLIAEYRDKLHGAPGPLFEPSKSAGEV